MRGHANASASKRIAVAIACTLAALLAFSSTSAFAGTRVTHTLLKTLDGSTTPAGSFREPTKIAVDQASESVYVIDLSHGVIDKFDASGNPQNFSALGTSALDGAGAGQADQTPQNSLGIGSALSYYRADIATDSSGNIYITSPDTELVTVFAGTGEYLYQFDGSETPTGSFGTACGVAVSSTGDIYVAGSSADAVRKFEPSGGSAKYVSEFSLAARPGEACDLAIDSEDNIYVNNLHTDVERFNPSGAFQNVVDAGPASYTVGVDPSDNHAYVGHLGGSDFIAEDDSSGNLLDEFGQGILTSDINGIGIVGAGTVFVSSYPAQRVYIFGPETVTVPDVTLGSATSVDSFDMTIKGTVNPSGASTSWHFRHRAQGSEAWTVGETHDAGSGSSVEAVSEELHGLIPATTYEVQLIATNIEINKTSRTSIQNSSTPPSAPVIGNVFVAPRAATTARLNGEVNPENSPTTYWFEYGTKDCATSSCESAPASHDAEAGNSLYPVLVAEEISGLSPGTTYHYRLVAENSTGVAAGPDRTFSTRTEAEMAVSDRGIELVNPPDKGNQTIYIQFELMRLGRNSMTQPISADGNQMLWTVESGAPNSNTGVAEPFHSVRGTGGWQTTSMAPPAAQQYDGGNSAYHLLAVNPEFKRSLFAVYNGFAAHIDTPIIRMNADGSQETLSVLPGNAGTNPQVLFKPLEATDDLAHVVLLPFWQAGPNHIYDYGTGTPEMLDIMPNGEPSCGISPNPPGFTDTGATEKTYHYIATTDASRVYFGTTNESCEGEPQLYVRNRDTETTTLVSGPPTSGPLRAVRFLRASADGKVAIFETATKLSEEDTNEGTDLYRYTEGSGTECLTCAVPNGNADLTPGPVLVSDDLSHIYFQSSQLLIPGEGKPGIPHIYVWHDGTVDFVANSALREVSNLSPISTTSLSSDGRVLLFGSQQHITADAIGPCESGCTEIYRYDSGDGSLECVSCRQGGVTNASVGRGGGAYLEYFMSADGETIGFSTATPLVTTDVNKAGDIYIWSHGVVHLVTDGVTEFPIGVGAPSVFGVSPSGRDIFFTVAAPLTGFEHDAVTNLYDARVGGGFAPPTLPAHCTEDSCQGPLQAPPELASPGSAGLGGPGDAVPRHRKPGKKRKHKPAHKRKQHSRRHAKQHRSRPHGRHGGGQHG